MAKKTLILVRHGQYHKASEVELERLTDLGRKQAKLVGKRLKEVKIDRIEHSTMPRAIETALLIKKELGYAKLLNSCADLCECVPDFPKELRKKYHFNDVKKLKSDKAQADRAFRKYFTRPHKNSTEVLVCHGNIIRYLICKALGVDTINWAKFDIQQCGISIVEIDTESDHKFKVLGHNDIGHIPYPQRTYL